MVDTTSTETVSQEEIKAMIVKLLVEELDIDEDQIDDSATMEELDLDSLDMVEIAQVAQRKYGVRVRPSDAEGITDLGGMVKLIHRKVNSNEPKASEDDE
ncbi:MULTISPECIES: acyl carrier protein [Mycobacteriaceae]|nr:MULTISPECIES: phosphopantetheine-binding protein [Mycobacteriaceae]